MCFTSAVFDQFGPWVPQPQPLPPVYPQPIPNVSPGVPWSPPMPQDELRELIEAFKDALQAAKTFDRITKQPDCEDPDKAKLIERVDELERRLDALSPGVES